MPGFGFPLNNPYEPQPGVIAPLRRAFDIMHDLLFRGGIVWQRWCVMGLVVFLANCSRGGGELNNLNNYRQLLPTPGPNTNTPVPAEFVPAIDWISANTVTVIAIWLTVVAIGVAIMALVRWISCRCEFIMYDQLAKGHWQLDVPWKEYERQGNSLFLVRMGISLSSTVLMTAAMIAVYLAYGAEVLEKLKTTGYGWPLYFKVLTGLLPLAPIMLVATIVGYFVTNHAVPIMYARNSLVMPALAEAWGHFRRQPGLFIGYFFVRLGLFIGAGIAMTATLCILCCLICIPGFNSYVITVITLPIWATLWAFSATFMEQFDDRYRIFRARPESPGYYPPPPGPYNPATNYPPVAPYTPAPAAGPSPNTPYTPNYVPPPPMPPPPVLPPPVPPTPPPIPPP